MPTLFVIRGNDQGARFELRPPVVALGREAASDIQLHDTEVSRQHAELRLEQQRCTIVDLGSSNGTFVNGERVDTRELTSGDHVQVGTTLLLFTGAVDEADGDIGEQVDIGTSGDGSRIVRAIAHEEGSRIFDWGAGGVPAAGLDRARSNLQLMYRTALAATRTLDIDQLLNRILQLIFDWVEADRGCIMLVHPETKQLEPKAYRARPGVRVPERITISRTILDYVMEHNEGVLTSNARDDQRWSAAASIVQLGVREAICVPLQARYEMVGVIYIDTFTAADRVVPGGSGNKFTDEHLQLMIAIAHQPA
ncbi:MAG: FHA domain-containing protein, partial [Pirellulales bacterium]|nr:FHA domain-containing protein [Pirellulales bacterium]